ncbi:hypothetical protein BASA81_001360 [Batrachochytrium salamandrivorans]|nr:hypothetical protein BASA81_001360 [Batrachochytrium salamandrivorans]
MGIPFYSTSTTGCVISVSPNSLTFTPRQQYAVTITSTPSFGIKAVLVGAGSTITNPGIDGILASQSTCVNYELRANQRAFTFTPGAAGVTIRALCGGDDTSMFVAQAVTLIASTGPPTHGPTSLSTNSDEDYSESSITLSPLLVGHIILSIVGFGLFVPWAVLLSLFNHNSTTPHKKLVCGLGYKTWLVLHLSCAMIGCLLGVAAFATGVVSKDSAEHFGVAHAWLSLVAMVFCLVQVAAGLTRNWWKLAFPYVHLVLGFGMVVLGLTACLTGVDVLAEFTSGLPYQLNGHVGEVGFSGPLGVAVAVICSVQLAALGVGFAQRFATMFVNQTRRCLRPKSMHPSTWWRIKGQWSTWSTLQADILVVLECLQRTRTLPVRSRGLVIPQRHTTHYNHWQSVRS